MVTLMKLTRPFRETDTTAKFSAPVRRKLNLEKQRLIFKANPRSKTTGEEYETRIAFRVKYVDQAKDSATIVTEDGRKRYALPSINSHAKVSCSCSDFLYTFAHPNKARGALLGKTAPLKEVKGKGLRAPRNPKQTPGGCKHIRGLAKKLLAKSLIKD